MKQPIKEYILFLDECKPNVNFEYFCLAGFIIEKNEYEQNLCRKMIKLKDDFWGNENIIFHSSEMKKNKGIFQNLQDTQIRENFWSKLSLLIDETRMTTISAFFNEKKYERIYPYNYLYDPYFLTLRNIIENFVVFLQKENAVGKVYIEGRTPSEDKMVADYYHRLLYTGTSFINRYALQSHLTTITFDNKEANNLGLQMADFIPTTLMRYKAGLSDKIGILPIILEKLYDGHQKNIKRFGLSDIL